MRDPRSPGAAEWRAAARARIATRDYWYHRIEIASGIVTPGVNDSPAVLALLDAIGLPRSFAGLRVLDVGCRDGFFAFEAERRGAAQIIGVDQVPPDQTGFAIASSLLESRVDYRVENVYDLTPERYGTFDLVLFLGVIYHLRMPALALDRLYALCRAGAALFVESEATTDPSSGSGPAWWRYFEHGQHPDPTVKWVPTPSGLAALLRDSQFDVTTVRTGIDRCLVRATARASGQLDYFRRHDQARDVREL